MSHTRVVKSCAVVIYSHGAIGNLIASVAVHIGNAQVVVALSGITGPLRCVGVEGPAVRQLFSVPVPCGNHRACVVSSAEDAAGMNAVEIGHACQIAFRTVGMVVAPVGSLSSFRHIVGCGHGCASQSVEHGDIFRSVHDASSLIVTMYLCVQESPPHVVNLRLCQSFGQLFLLFLPLPASAYGVLALLLQLAAVGLRIGLDGSDAVTPVGLGIADDLSLSVDGTVGRLHHQLCPSVTIEVVHHELGEVSARADVVSQVDAPQLGAVEPVTVDVGIGRESGKHIVFGV